MRLFVASFFEPLFVEAISDIAGRARANAGSDAVKWVERRNYHLSYAFLGEVGPAAVERAVQCVDEVVAGCRAFTLSLGPFGAFPSAAAPRVLWLGVDKGAAALRELAGKLRGELSLRGFEPDKRFEPHITVGRVRRRLPEGFFDSAADYAKPRPAESVLSSVEVMESLLAPEGASYRPVCSRRLL